MQSSTLRLRVWERQVAQCAAFVVEHVIALQARLVVPRPVHAGPREYPAEHELLQAVQLLFDVPLPLHAVPRYWLAAQDVRQAVQLLLVVLPTAQAVPRYWLAGQDVLQAGHEYPAVVEPVR